MANIILNEKTVVMVRAEVYNDAGEAVTNTNALEITIGDLINIINARTAALDPATATAQQILTAQRTPPA